MKYGIIIVATLLCKVCIMSRSVTKPSVLHALEAHRKYCMITMLRASKHEEQGHI